MSFPLQKIISVGFARPLKRKTGGAIPRKYKADKAEHLKIKWNELDDVRISRMVCDLGSPNVFQLIRFVDNPGVIVIDIDNINDGYTPDEHVQTWIDENLRTTYAETIRVLTADINEVAGYHFFFSSDDVEGILSKYQKGANVDLLSKGIVLIDGTHYEFKDESDAELLTKRTNCNGPRNIKPITTEMLEQLVKTGLLKHRGVRVPSETVAEPAAEPVAETSTESVAETSTEVVPTPDKKAKKRGRPKKITWCSPEFMTICLGRLSPADFEEHDIWFSLMCAVHNSLECRTAAINIFINFSAKMSNFDENELRKKWATIRDDPKAGDYGLGSIRTWMEEYVPVIDKKRLNGEFSDKYFSELCYDVNTAMTYFNHFHGFVESLAMFVRLAYDEEGEPSHHDDFQKTTFVTMYQHLTIGFERKEFLKLWFKSPKNVYRSITANPEHGARDLLMLPHHAFRPKPTIVTDAGTGQSFVNHLRRHTCRGNEELFEYVTHWLAHLVQKPNEKIGTALVIVGEQGTGKGAMFCQLLGKIVGQGLYSHVDSIGSLSSFNDILNDRSLVVMDEVEKSGIGHKMADMIKSLITESWMQTRRKFIPDAMAYQFQNYIFLSNNDAIVKVESTDRRFCVMETDPTLRGATAYFDELFENIKDDMMVQDFVNWLGSIDLEEWRAIKIPHTEAREAMREVDLIDQFLIDVFHPGFVGPAILGASLLFDYFKKWADEGNLSGQHVHNRITLGRLWPKYLGQPARRVHNAPHYDLRLRAPGHEHPESTESDEFPPVVPVVISSPILATLITEPLGTVVTEPFQFTTPEEDQAQYRPDTGPFQPITRK